MTGCIKQERSSEKGREGVREGGRGEGGGGRDGGSCGLDHYPVPPSEVEPCVVDGIQQFGGSVTLGSIYLTFVFLFVESGVEFRKYTVTMVGIDIR